MKSWNPDTAGRYDRSRKGAQSMRIAEIAPPWVKVPPEGYGGIEWIVSLLADGLVERGHEVTLYASGDSTTQAGHRPPLRPPLASVAGAGTTL